MKMYLTKACIATAITVVLMAAAPVAGEDLECFASTDTVFAKEDWMYCQHIQPNLLMYYTPKEETVQLGLHAVDTFGWTSLSLSGNGGMKGASQIVVRKDEKNDNKWVAEDRFSTDYTMPTLDEQQDVKLLFAQQSDDGVTAWGVELPMNSCDDHDYPIQNITTSMLWAFGDSHTFGFHGPNRGQFSANLMNEPVVFSEATGDFVDMRMPDVPVVLGEGGTDATNPYICSYFNMSEVLPENVESGQTVHVTRFEPLLNEASKQYVHHMILFACTGDEDAGPREHLQIIPECESMPPGCFEMKWPWAVGSEPVVLPEDVGLPFRGGWLVLQTHYYNPNLDENVIDSSGVRAYYTTDLRPQEAGVMMLNGGTGPWHRQAIPAGQKDFDIEPFVIPSSCTSWSSPLTILGVGHHMHVVGKHMDISVYRNGESLGPLREEHQYDFNHQALGASPIGTLEPGDELYMNCRYDTSGVTDDVQFGDLTQQEMCFAVMLYYPLQKQQSFTYAPVWFNATECTQPGTGPFANVSQCAQSYFENIPAFFNFEDDVEQPFDALTMCNADWYETTVEPDLPNICPPCSKSKNCTAEEVVGYGQMGVCQARCGGEGGVTVWPDTSQTEPYTQTVYGCMQEGVELQRWGGYSFVAPSSPPAGKTCEAKGISLVSDDNGGSMMASGGDGDGNEAPSSGTETETTSSIGNEESSSSGDDKDEPSSGASALSVAFLTLMVTTFASLQYLL